MKKVRMIVEMDEELYKAFAEQDIFICGMRTGKTLLSEIWKAVKNATPLTECDDCVSREETIMCLTGINLPTDIDKLIALYNERIKALPPVLPKREQGKWKQYEHSTFRGLDEDKEPIWGKAIVNICDKCGRRTVIKDNFCPNCGAEMR